MRRSGFRRRMMREYARSTRSGWRARIWHGRRARPKRIIEDKAGSRPMKRIWMLIGAAVVVLSACGPSQPKGTVFVSGRIDGDTVDISSKIPGRIVNLTVREGDSVEDG